ncbi:MAG: hypothetical protein KDB01_23350 [Planctomycetaceae bacterium]|nr:hypothetical protein [Planctomycetaceae bacterium]
MLNQSMNRVLFRRYTVLPLLGASIFAIMGCGGESVRPGRERVRASGKVSFDGTAVPAGGVSFQHKQSGNLGYCPIVDGVYQEEDGQGPVIGENTLTVTGLDMVDGKPLWGGVYSKDVTITQDGFQEDFAISSSDVQPKDSNYINVDEE